MAPHQHPTREGGDSWRIVLVSALGTLLASCAQGPPPTAKPAADFGRLEPVVSIRFDKTPAFGQLAEATLTVTNATVEPILIESIDLEGQLPFLAEGGVSLPGGLRYRSGGDFYLYDSRRPGETPPVFAPDRLLLPAESHDLRARIRVRLSRQPVEISFRRIPMNDLLDGAYFPVVDPHDQGPLRWKRLNLTKLAGFRSGAPGSLDRTVLIPDRGSWPITVARKSLKVLISDAAHADRVLHDAGASAGSTITRWSGKSLWVIDDPAAGRTFAIDDGGRRWELPRCDLEVFDLLDGLPPGQSIPVYRGGASEPLRRITAAQADSLFQGARTQRQTVRAAWSEDGRGGFEHSLELEIEERAVGTSPPERGEPETVH
jgi:hypothetical protein